VHVHKMDVDTLTKGIRCIQKEEFVTGKGKATLLRIFRLSEIKARGIEVTGWETFDQYPELVLFEGYWQEITNEANLTRKREEAGSSKTK
jgi:hypothetical protein